MSAFICSPPCLGTSLVVQWLRLCVPSAGAAGLIPGQGTGSHMPQQKDPTCHSKGGRSCMLQLRLGQ